MNFFSDYRKVCRTEWLKLKGTGIIWIILIMAAFIPGIFTLVGLIQSESGIITASAVNPWKQLIQSCFSGFSPFFFPVFLTLIVIRLTQMEHRGGGWKLIETQPISKSSLYLGKFSMSLLITAFCILALVAFSLLGGTAIMLIKGAKGFSTNSIPVNFILELSARLFISGLGILGIQYLFSVIISGFIGPFSIGLVSTITGTILMGFGKALWFPYSAPGLTSMNAEGSATGNFLLHFEWLSITWMTLALWLGFQWYNRKTFSRAFFNPLPRMLHVLIPGLIFAFLFGYINQPVELPAHNRTVIAGSIDAKESIQKAYLIREPMMDTVVEIPVEKNRFHFPVEKIISPSVYYIKCGNMPVRQVFFGSGDSLYIRMKYDGKSLSLTSSGNRMAENKYISSNNDGGDFEYSYLTNYGYEMKPNTFAAEVKRQWSNEIAKVDNYKTVDNLKPADDFVQLQKKLITLRYLQLLDIKYPQWFRVYNPNDKLEWPASVDVIRKTASFSDSTLISYSSYRDLMTEYFGQQYKLTRANDTTYLTKVSQLLPPGIIRDYLLYTRTKESVERTRDSMKREEIVSRSLALITETSMKQQLLAHHQLLKSLHRGKPAPGIQAIALNRDTFSLEDFKGRYVVIDVWATWCGPCKVQSPNFERLAEQYTSPQVAFVALSIDDNQWMWRNEASEKSPLVLQLIAENKNRLGASYGIEAIPRFILLNPEGKIINVQLPYPSEPEFEEILVREIPGLVSG